jgi:hypothetical protein
MNWTNTFILSLGNGPSTAAPMLKAAPLKMPLSQDPLGGIYAIAVLFKLYLNFSVVQIRRMIVNSHSRKKIFPGLISHRRLLIQPICSRMMTRH